MKCLRSNVRKYSGSQYFNNTLLRKITGRRDFKVSEIFESIQGEGPQTGTSAVFLRTSLCNLKCSWCDTKYTWDWENYDYKKEVKEMTIHEVKNEVTKYNNKHLVITGGEPLLQQEDIAKLLKEIKPYGYFVEVETNCTIKPSNEILQYVDQWNVSPKTSNSGNVLQSYEVAECYNFFVQQNNAYFKFVIESDDDMNEVEYFIEKYNLPRKKVLLMPQASDKNELKLREDMVFELSKDHELGYSSRMHIVMWDNQRGK